MKFKWRNILILFGLLLAVVLLIDFNRRMEELDNLTAKLNSVRAEGTSILQTQAALKTQVAFATSDQAVEQWARSNKMVKAGEQPVQLEPSGTVTPTPVAVPLAQTEALPNWRVWWQLFFGAN
jgi:cell division protein FtsB